MIRLSGARYFSLAVLGGGTMMNGYSESLVTTLLDSGVRFVSLGTGAGSGGWDLRPGYDLERWIPLLRRFEWVTVRGPRTQRALREAGFEAADVIGDLALAYTTAGPAQPAKRPQRIFYNVIERGPDEVWSPSVFEALGRVLSRYAAEGWEIVPFAMAPGDRLACRSFADRYGIDISRMLLPHTGRELVDELTTAGLVVSMRLHGTVFATAAGSPTVSIAYREKCTDFMESVGAGNAVMAVSTPGETPAIQHELDARISWAVAHIDQVHANAIARRSAIRARAASVAGML